jgi:hypothetical protein
VGCDENRPTGRPGYFQRELSAPLRQAGTSASPLDRATTLAPDLPETAAARGYYFYWGFRDCAQAMSAFEEARRGLPNDASLLAVMAFLER